MPAGVPIAVWPGRIEGTEPVRGVSRRPSRRLAHAVETARRLSRLLVAAGTLQRADAGIGALERLVLHQHGLHQRIGRIRRPPKPLDDGAFGLRVSRPVLEPGKAIEELRDELAFLRGHGPSPGSISILATRLI